jgi:tetratricopeptide (TPR) repeat protein
MPRRLIAFAAVILLAFAAAVGSLLTNLIVGDQTFTRWLRNQHWYSLRNALLGLAVTVFITIGLEIWHRRAAERPPERVPLNFNNAVVSLTDNRSEAAPPDSQTPSAIPRPGAIEFIPRCGGDGRDFVSRLKEEFAAPKNPLINLWGPGGVGKTALAAEAARQLASDFQGRVVWTGPELRSGFSFSILLDEVASQLGRPDLRQTDEKTKKQLLHGVLAERRTLIVVDNYETIPEQDQNRCTEWLAHDAPCPAMVTSRTVLDPARNIQIGTMNRTEAREFVEHVISQRANQHIFDAPIRERIIAIAGFNPLLMEWIVRQIDLARDPDRVLADLAQGASAATERVFDRSFKLRRLGNAGRGVLMALSLFVPDASPPALAAVAGFGEDLEGEKFRRFASVARLWNRLGSQKRLTRKLAIAFPLAGALLSFIWLFVRQKKLPGSRATEMLDRAVMPLADLLLVRPVANKRLMVEGLTRELARARLAAGAGSRQCRRRFVDHFAHYATMHSDATPENYDELEKERENILTAARIAFESGDGQFARHLFVLMADFLRIRGYWDDYARLGELALQSAQLENDPSEIARCASGLAEIRVRRGELAEARRLYEEQLALAKLEVDKSQAEVRWRHQDGTRRPPKKLNGFGRLRVVRNMRDLAGRMLEESRLSLEKVAKTRADNARKRMAENIGSLGDISLKQGDPDDAERLFREWLRICRELNDQNGVARALHALGAKATDQGDFDAAAQFYGESLEIFKREGTESQVAEALNSLGVIAKQKRDFAEARRLHEESLEIKKKLGDQEGIADSVANLGGVAAASGDLIEGMRLYGEALKILDPMKSPKAKLIRRWLEEKALEQAPSAES